MKKDAEYIKNKVIQILADKLDIELEKIKPESKLIEDLGMDSFGAIEMAFALEEEFKLKIPEADLEGVNSVSDIINYLKYKNEEHKLDS